MNNSFLNKLQRVLLASGLLLFLFSCETSSPDDFFDDDSGAVPGTLTLSADEELVFKNSTIQFTVLDDNNNDVTDQSQISVDGVVINGSSTMIDVVGDFSISAIYNGTTSNSLMVESIDPSFTAKVLIEDYTGAWCGWCPRISQGIDDLATNPKVVAIAIHNNDPMAFRQEQQLTDAFNVNSYPTGILNRDTRWGRLSAHSMDLNEPLTLLNRAVGADLRINSVINGSQIEIKVDAAFRDARNDTKLVVLALENGLVGPQENYTNNYGGPRNIPDFEHNHVLRANLSDLFGDVIPMENQAARKVFSSSYTYDATGVADIPAMEIVAILVDAAGRVINVQKALAGTFKAFD
jgi:thiol-disulfide isomerase/thioredoxin